MVSVHNSIRIAIVAIAGTPYSTSTPEKAAIARTYLFWGRSTQTLV